jgi:hypothetical protein
MQRILAILAVSLLAGCSSSSKPAARVYSATASVGDFLVITIHPDTLTIDYENRTTSASGTVAYTVEPDGTYAITDPDGHLLSAYEIPGLALVMESDGMGPGGTEKALIVGVEKAPLVNADLAGQGYSMLQFRTHEGGVEVGHVTVASDGDVSVTNYIPAWELYGRPSSFSFKEIPGENFVEDAATGSIGVTVPEEGGGTSTATVFGTPGGYLAIDGENGSMFGVRDAATKDFLPEYAGTYLAIAYSKHDVTLGPGPGEETGTAEVSTATVTITAGTGSGHILVEPEGGTHFESELIPLEDEPEFYGTGKIEGHPNGLFVFRDESGSAVFVVFMDRSLAFGRYRISDLATREYEYLYGFALKQS